MRFPRSSCICIPVNSKLTWGRYSYSANTQGPSSHLFSSLLILFPPTPTPRRNGKAMLLVNTIIIDHHSVILTSVLLLLPTKQWQESRCCNNAPSLFSILWWFSSAPSALQWSSPKQILLTFLLSTSCIAAWILLPNLMAGDQVEVTLVMIHGRESNALARKSLKLISLAWDLQDLWATSLLAWHLSLTCEAPLALGYREKTENP